MKDKKLTVVILAVLSAATAFAETGFETAKVHIGYRGRKEEVRTVACQRQPDGAWRFHMPTRDIPRDAWYVDVFTDGATLPKGEGYWVTGDGNYGRLTRDTGFHETYATRMPLFGGVSAKGAFVAIIKTLRGEYVQQVKAVKGVCRICPRHQSCVPTLAVFLDFIHSPLRPSSRLSGLLIPALHRQLKRV